jgi:exodeoxyribonuclease VII large subunit
VGHEVDFTIADFVADLRAATPSNAAELVVDRAANFRARINRAERQLVSAMQLQMGARQQRAERLDARLAHWPATVALRRRDGQELALRLRHAVVDQLARTGQRFDDLRRRLERRDLRRVAADLRARLVGADHRMRAAMVAGHVQSAARVRESAARLHALSPLAVLGRGYALCWDGSRTSIIRSADALKPGDPVRVTLAQGELACTVTDTAPPQPPRN